VHGIAGVGKSAIAFTIAERMKGLQMTESRPLEKRLAGTFFFSRNHTNRSTTGYLFATLAYQLARNFQSVRAELIAAIDNDPALLQPQKSLHDQMEALFLLPLRRLQLRLPGCPPLVFIVDALDECTSKDDISLLISLLGRALHDPGIPVTHILLTSRSESHVSKAIRGKEVHSVVCEIPVIISSGDDTSLISLDGADVDSDIYKFLECSFADKRSSCPGFPQTTEEELTRLASRAGRRFIVASTMVKFIDDGYSDPHDRLQLMLELTSDLLPGTELYEFYDSILLTCANIERAHLHLSVVVALANPLPISQISELLGSGQGRDVEEVLVQLRSIMDIPIDKSLPVSIYHSSVRDYVSERLIGRLLKGQDKTPHPHALLALSSFRLMIRVVPQSTGLPDAFSKLQVQRAKGSHHFTLLLRTLLFVVEPLAPVGVLIALLWIWGERKPLLYGWLKTLDGQVWLRNQEGRAWLRTQGGKAWLRTQGGEAWLQSSDGLVWRLIGKGNMNLLQGITEHKEQLMYLKRRMEQRPREEQEIKQHQSLKRTHLGLLQEQLEQLKEQPELEQLEQEQLEEQLEQAQLEQEQLEAQLEQLHLEAQLEQVQLEQAALKQVQLKQAALKQVQLEQAQLEHTPLSSTNVQILVTEFLETMRALDKFTGTTLPIWRIIQQFRSLPDLLLFPTFLAFVPDCSTSAVSSPHCPDMEIIHAMCAFVSFADGARERSRLASDALIYACQNWAFHLLQAPNPKDKALNNAFNIFWERHLAAWLEMQWCLGGLKSCLAILSEAQKFVQ